MTKMIFLFTQKMLKIKSNSTHGRVLFFHKNVGFDLRRFSWSLRGDLRSLLRLGDLFRNTSLEKD